MSIQATVPVRKSIDKYIPWFFVLFFLVLSCLMGLFAWIAISTDRGVVSKHAYEQGIAYNQILEKQRAQDALGWTSDITIAPPVNGQASHVTVRLLDKHRKPITRAVVQFNLIRPTQAGHDVSAMMQDEGSGTYTADITVPMPGLWEAHISVKQGEHTYQADKRVTLP